MKQHYSFSKIRFVIAVVSVCLMAAASLNGQTGSGDIRPRLDRSATPKPPSKPPSRNHARSQSSVGARLARERAERNRRAEEAAAEDRDARPRADEERREREQVWHVSIIRNRTKNPIVYKYTCGNSWRETTVEPGAAWIHTRRNKAVVVKFEAGGETKQYDVEALKVVGHKPTDSDEEAAEANVNNFRLDANGNVALYSKR